MTLILLFLNLMILEFSPQCFLKWSYHASLSSKSSPSTWSNSPFARRLSFYIDSSFLPWSLLDFTLGSSFVWSTFDVLRSALFSLFLCLLGSSFLHNDPGITHRWLCNTQPPLRFVVSVTLLLIITIYFFGIGDTIWSQLHAWPTSFLPSKSFNFAPLYL